MNFRTATLATTLALTASTGLAQEIFAEDFEDLDPANPSALADAGWLVFANVFDPGGGYLYGYGPFPAPNGGPGFCAVATGQGGSDQGNNQLVTYSDYNNGDHANGNIIEANVFLEDQVPPEAVGTIVTFSFDAKRGDIAPPTTSQAFIKIIDSSVFSLDGFASVDTTDMPVTWSSFSVSLEITPDHVGDFIQIGFSSNATNYDNSGQFYDNINFREDLPCTMRYCGTDQNAENAASLFLTDCDSSTPVIFVAAESAPPGEFAVLCVGNGDQTIQPPGSNGDLCITGGSVLGRYTKEAGVIDGRGFFGVDIQNSTSLYILNNVAITPGSTWNFQLWHRNNASSTFSDALSVTFN